MLKGKLIACDTETTGLRLWHGDLPFAMSFCNEALKTYYLEWPVDPRSRQVIPDPVQFREVKSFFEDESITKVFHHAKFDVRALEMLGIKVAGPRGKVSHGGTLHDTMFMARIFNTLEPSVGLKQLTKKYLAMDDDDESDLKKLVRRCRTMAKKLGWKIAYSESWDKNLKLKLKAMVETDYWLPSALYRHDKKLVSKEEASYCRYYATRDALRTMCLWHALWKILQDDACLSDTYRREMDLWPVTYQMETRGARIDPEILESEIEHYKGILKPAKKKLEQLAWKGFNPDSPPQMRKLLFRKYNIPVKSKTKTGVASVDQDALQDYLDVPVVDAVMKYRAGVKALTSFHLKYKTLAVPTDGLLIVHPSFRQLDPVTGRYSCAEPNFQNVPAIETTKSQEPISARAPFGPRPGYCWYHWDYSQLELRLFASLFKIKSMLRTLAADGDIPTDQANEIWGGEGNDRALWAAVYAVELVGTHTPPEEVRAVWKSLGVRNERQRSLLSMEEAKRVVEPWLRSFNWDIVKGEQSLGKKNSRARAKITAYTKIYGGGAGALMGMLRCPKEEAREVLDAYDDKFPEIKEKSDEYIEKAKARGYVINAYDRKLRIDPDFAYRSINYRIQSTAADLLKESMKKVYLFFRDGGVDGYVLMNIHDELVGELKSPTRYSVLNRVIDLMEDTDGRLPIKMKVNLERVRSRWDQKEKVDCE